MTNHPSDSSSTMEEAEVEEPEDIIKDLSDNDNDSADNNGQTNTEDKCDEDDEEEQESKLTEFHAKNYFNSTMGGKDLRVLFAMAIG